MLKRSSFSIQLTERFKKSLLHFVLVVIFSMILSGCNYSSQNDGNDFEEKYSAAQNKYAKYLQGPVSGQEVLDLIDNWDESDFGLSVEDSEGGRFGASNLDKNTTIFTYWDEGSTYYIDPNASYKASFIIYQPPKNGDKAISELYFSFDNN